MQERNIITPESVKEIPGFLITLISDFFKRLFYIFRIVWETRKWILFLMVFMALFNGVMPVAGAYINANLLNALAKAFLQQVDFKLVTFLLGLQFGYFILISIVNNIYSMLNNIAGQLVVNHIKLKIMYKAKEVDMASFDSPEFYKKLENANREAGHRPIQVINSTFNIISTLITMISFITILWVISPFAPFIIILVSIPSAIINFIYRRKNFMYMRRRSKDRRQMNYYSGLVVDKDLVKEVRMFNLSDFFIGCYKETFDKYFAGLKKLIRQEGFWHIGLSILSSVVNFLLFVFIARQVIAGKLQVGDYALYTGALNTISSGVAALIATTAGIFEGTLFIDNMIEFMNEKRTIVPSTQEPGNPVRHVGHVIQFENVSFRYPGTERDVLKNINLTINAGDTVVLVGLNGAGKTTLIKLLTRLYDPTEGRILLDGKDIREYDVDEYYKIFGVIFQDFGKYAFKVNENISFGQIDKGFDSEGIYEAALKSDADSFIQKLPDKYETPLMRIFEENGIELSIGMWQKLAIARAFYSDSDILILDEPTASLDPMAEKAIYEQFDELRKGKTSIFVSHRLSSTTLATKIVVLEYGEIIEEGSHRELMELKGRYYELFSTQASRYVESYTELD